MSIDTFKRLITRVAGKLPLRTVLIVPFVVQIVGTVGLVGYLSFKSGQKSVEDIAQQLMTQVGERVSDRLTIYLQAPQDVVSANYLAVKQGILSINNFEQLQQQLWQQLTLNPSLESLYFTNEAGEEIGYGRIQSEEVVKQAEKLSGEDLSIGIPHIGIQRSADPGKRKYYLVDSKGNPRKLFYTFLIDSSTTTWYRTAKASKQQTWSPISVYKVLPLLGIFAVTSIYNQTGKWQGVFASSFTLSSLNTFLNQLKFSPSGQIFIIDHSGNLVAKSTLEIPLQLEIIERKQTELELQQAKEAAETANQAKSTFLANMSHELRTPLNAILGFARLIGNNPTLPLELQAQVSIINRSGEHLLTLINDVLNLAKIEANRTTLNEQDFDLYKLLYDVEQMFFLKAQAKGLQLIIDRDDAVPQYVRTDELKLCQVLLNLLSNAIKFTEEGGVTLCVGLGTGEETSNDANQHSQ